MAEFFAMGGYAAFVWSAYGVTALVLAGLGLATVLSARRARAALHEAEQQIQGRRRASRAQARAQR